MRNRLLTIATLCLLAPISLADKRVMKFEFAGAPAGENVYERNADGTFTSDTTFEVMGTKIVSNLKGKFEGKKLVSFDMKQTVGASNGQVSYSNGNASVTQGGKTTKLKATFKSTALFGNYHPQITNTVAEALSSSQPGMQPVKGLVLDSLTEITIQAGFTAGRQAKRDGKTEPIRILTLDFGTAKFDYPLDSNNNVVGMNFAAQKFEGTVVGWSDLYVDPVAKYKELSQPTHKTTRMTAVKMPMRDGVALVADIVMPAEAGKYPVILSRTPYGRAGSLIGADWWAKRGYVFISQDVRGRHDSEGKWDPFMNERGDGYDTIEWISKQDWCDGNVGMIGGSYVGMVQWQAAVERHPALKCIVPQVSPPDGFFNIPYDHGIFMLWGNLWWSNIVKDKVSRMDLAMAPLRGIGHINTLPLSTVDNKVFGRNIPWFDEWLKKDRASQFKGMNFESDMASVNIPALHISGWWDGDGIGTKRNWAAMAKAGKKNQWLIYGPWTHAFNTSSKLGDINYGSSAILELDSIYLRWFDTWLKGMDVGQTRQPKARIFLTGANEWRYLNGWPDAAAKKMTLYLGSFGGGIGGASKGTLQARPATKSKPSTYIYDPAKVEIPKELTKNMDPGAASTRMEVTKKDRSALVFKSAAMTQPMDFAGPIEVDLYFSTNAKDTDFFTSIVDIDPKGVMRQIGMTGKMRAKYISGWETPSLLTPGKVYKMTVQPWDTAHRFKKGHRLGLVIVSQQFPVYARNLNTGEPYWSAKKMVVATQKIYHDAARPSAIRFYLLPPK